MRLHKVYQHETKGYFAVKVGFAWFGLFFNVFWLLFKGVFWISFLTFIFAIYMNIVWFVDGMADRPIELYSTRDWALIIGAIFIPFLVGFQGNKWVAKNLEKRGYLLNQIIPSPSKKDAIAQTKNLKSTQQPVYAAWGRQDSYQPGHRHIKKEKNAKKESL
jgi:hypothetical protein